MDKNSALYGMTAYDIIYDTILLEQELETRRRLYHDYRDYELFDGDSGYVSFLVEKVEEFEKQAKEYYLANGNPNNWSIVDAMSDFVGKNIHKWIRQLKGDNLYKVKVVLELDVESADKLDTVVSNVKELFYDKSVEDYGCDAIKDVRVVNAVGKEVDE